MKNNEMKLTTKDIILIGISLAIMEVLKIALGGLPGVEFVSLLVIIYTLYFRKKIIYLLTAFCIIEGVLYGFGIWWFMYLYIWFILAFVVYLFRYKESAFFWSILCGIYGLIFGLLCSPIYFITGGLNMAISWWIAGLTIDVVHGISNFFLCLILFKPLKRVLDFI